MQQPHAFVSDVGADDPTAEMPTRYPDTPAAAVPPPAGIPSSMSPAGASGAADRSADVAAELERLEQLFEALLFSVSHDLKSPLLTLSLSSELLTNATDQSGERATVAAAALQRGVTDMERLLDAVTAVSRAGRRTLRDGPVPVAQLLRGNLVMTDGTPGQALAACDPRPLVDALEALTDARNGVQPEMRLLIGDHEATLALGLPAEIERPTQPTPLAALFDSLHTYAGTAVETLAVLEAQLRRQGGAVTLDAHAVSIRLPLTPR